jgi:uncharacterized membrane protein YhaH (DUF805 family)
VPIFRTGGPRSPLAWLLFSYQGRISRSLYWTSYVLLIAINGVLVGQLVGGEQASFHRLAQAVGPIIIIATIYSNLAITVKRLHDIGYSGFLALAIFVPLVNFAFTIWAGIVPGAPGPNSYGDTTDAPPV